jgi:hypothetical protein
LDDGFLIYREDETEARSDWGGGRVSRQTEQFRASDKTRNEKRGHNRNTRLEIEYCTWEIPGVTMTMRGGWKRGYPILSYHTQNARN